MNIAPNGADTEPLSELELQLKLLDRFLTRLREGDPLLSEHAIEMSDADIESYNRRGSSTTTMGTFLTPPPNWFRLARTTLAAWEAERFGEECRADAIDFLWQNCFAEAATAWNRDYRPILAGLMPGYTILPITHEVFVIWLESWP